MYDRLSSNIFVLNQFLPELLVYVVRYSIYVLNQFLSDLLVYVVHYSIH